MKQKIRKALKNRIFLCTLTAIIFGTVGVSAATYFSSKDVTYDNTESGLKSKDVQGAIDELYNTCFPPLSSGEQIIKDANLTMDLYEDRYFFIGIDVNNYIIFNGETWRILSIEGDGRIKIVSNTVIEDRAYSTNYSNNWTRPATLNDYLNQTYINTLSDKDKVDTNLTWSIGAVTHVNNNLGNQISDENSKTWDGRIALITASEYLRTNSNKNNCETYQDVFNNYNSCKNTTWLYINDDWWTLSAYKGDSEPCIVVKASGSLSTASSANNSYGVRPTLYLKSTVKITGGTGTQNDPYTIE